jgi:putative Mn2+ efflux pump MntP
VSTGVAGLLLFGLLSGLDNLHVSAALGASGMPRRRLVALAAAFAACEAGMPLIGLAAGSLLHRTIDGLEMAGPLVLLGCGAVILVQALREGPEPEDVGGGWLFALPLALSFDNLLAGVGLGSAGYPVVVSALVVGGVSGGMCLSGLFFGAWLGRWIPGRAEVLSGAVLVAMGLVNLARSLA